MRVRSSGKPGNYLVALGTPLRFVLESLGFRGDARQLIMGGPMMGASVASLDVPVTKGISGILVTPFDDDGVIFDCDRGGATSVTTTVAVGIIGGSVVAVDCRFSDNHRR